MLEYTGKGNQLSSRLIHAIIDDLIVWVESRGNIGKTLVFYRILHTEFEDIEAIIHLEILTHMLHVESIELGLGITQSHLHL